MGLIVIIFKGIDIALASIQLADKGITKVTRWNKQRKFERARKARLIKQIKKS
jgi:hypothetical protein